MRNRLQRCRRRRRLGGGHYGQYYTQHGHIIARLGVFVHSIGALDFIVFLVFAICWAGISVRQILRHQGDDTILGYIGTATAAAFVYLALRYSQKAQGGGNS